jgi:hypothetical protein
LKIFKYILTIGFVLSFANQIQAQFTKNLEISSYYDDNLFRSPTPTADLLTNIEMSLNYRPQDSNMNLYYSGSFLLYRDTYDRNFSLHGFGLYYNHPFGDEDRHTLYLGSDGTIRLNGEDYNYYDYTQIYLYSNIRFDLDLLSVKAGYNFRYRNYSNLPDLSNSRHFVFLQANKSFASRTTIIFEADLGYKSFAGENTYSTSSEGGRGQGNMVEESQTTTATEIPSLSQAIVLTRLAQSLHENLGVFIQYRRQISLTDQTNYINADGYYQDEELFDDPFSYESSSFSSGLTWILPWSMKIQINGSLFSKNYISEQAYITEYDSVGLGGTRIDDQKSIYFNFYKTFYIDKSWLNLLKFNIYYGYIDNDSNSYWYRYKNAIFGGGIQWTF